jgi:phosphoglycolate phosphatase
MRVTTVLFDLDGTLIDSAPGITSCLAETIRRFGGPALKPATLRAFVGPPVADTLRTLTDVPQSGLSEVIEHYRALYLERGIAESSVFPGIRELLGMLRERGLPLAVATSKRQSHARAILELHGLDSSFAAVSGAAEDESASAKDVVIRAALELLAGGGADTAGPMLIGDRSFDIRGAAAAGVPSMFAAWGYGATGEAEGAALVATDPFEAGVLLQALGAPGSKVGSPA